MAITTEQMRLRARPGHGADVEPFEPGLHRLGLRTARDALLLVPRRLRQPAPLVVLLHGAGGNAEDILPLLSGPAERDGFFLLVPQSHGKTWDVIVDGFGPDVEAIEAALARVFEREDVAADRIAIAGFSDGASYALSLGIPNGDLFADVLAFSPGFTVAQSGPGRPAIFISHGRGDAVLPIDACSRRIVRLLRAQGYAIDYREFDGGHVVPPALVAAALAPCLGRAAPAGSAPPSATAPP